MENCFKKFRWTVYCIFAILTTTYSHAAKKDTTLIVTNNPIVKYKYLGDPAALVHNGTLYIYAGHDEAPAPQQFYLMKEWCILSTKDMKHFTEHAYTLKATDFKWAKGDAWASQAIERDGKFYWSSEVDGDQFGRFCGVYSSCDLFDEK